MRPHRGRVDCVSPALQAGASMLERLYERPVPGGVPVRHPDAAIPGAGMDHHHRRGHGCGASAPGVTDTGCDGGLRPCGEKRLCSRAIFSGP